MNLYLQGCTPAHAGVEVVDEDTNKVVATSPDSWAALEYIVRAETLAGYCKSITRSDKLLLRSMFNI